MKAFRALSTIFGVAIAVTVLIFLAVQFAPRKYYLTVSAGYPGIFYSKSDLILLETKTSIASARTPWVPKTAFWRLVVRAPQAVVETKTIFTHYSKGNFDSQNFDGYLFANFDEKDLYVQKYTKDSTECWKWNGKSLDRLNAVPDAIADEEDDTPPPSNSLWKSAKIYNKEVTPKVIHLPLGGEDLTVTIPGRDPQQEYWNKQSIVIKSPTVSEPFVMGTTPPERQISRAEFERITAGKSVLNAGAIFWKSVLIELFTYLGIPMAVFAWRLWPLFTLKSKLVELHTDQLSFPPATLDQFAGLNREALQAATTGYEQLGFKTVADHSIVRGSGVQIPIFARLMVNNRENCLAEIAHIMPPNRKLIFMTSVESILSDGWTLGTVNTKPHAQSVLWRRPRAVGKHMPGAEPSQLLSDHLMMRSQMMADLHITPKKDLTSDFWFVHCRSEALARREALQRHLGILILPMLLICKFRVRNEWRGDWPRLAAQLAVPQVASTYAGK